MFLKLEVGELHEGRVRPSRRPRWRAYAPPIALLVPTLFLLAPPRAIVEPVMGLGLTPLGAVLLVGATLVAAATLVAWLVGRHPLVTLVAGATGLSAGANLFEGAWLGLPLLLIALGWIACHEGHRAFEGITLTNRRVVLPRTLRRPLALPYEDVRAVHTTHDQGPVGSLILETSHGTLAAPDLPDAAAVRERIEARMGAIDVRPEPASMAEARARLERLLAGHARPVEGEAA